MLEGGGGAEGRREGGDWRRAAGRWATGAGWGHGRACAARGAPRGSAADLRSKVEGSAAFRSDLLEIVFAHVQVSMCARTYSKVKVAYHSRHPGHIVDGRARSGERSLELWTGVENRGLNGYEG